MLLLLLVAGSLGDPVSFSTVSVAVAVEVVPEVVPPSMVVGGRVLEEGGDVHRRRAGRESRMGKVLEREGCVGMEAEKALLGGM